MMKQYEKYKKTGNIWFGSIPSNWNVCKIKHISRTYAGGTPSTETSEFWEGGNIPWLPSGKLQNCEITTAEKFITDEGLKNSSTKWIKPYTTLIALTGATCANIGYLTFKACANQSVVAIDEVKEKANSRFLYYMLLSIKRQILTHQTGGAQAGINDSDVKNLFITQPTVAEQTQIALYLDYQTNIIDKLISKKQKLIQLLKEKRQAIINEAVTKGLKPNSKMKDSGIEWLGKVPEGWVITKSKIITELITDGAHISPDTSNNDFPFVSTVDLNNGVIDFENCLKTSAASYEYLVNTGCKPKLNDVLYSKDGTIGKTTVIKEEIDFVVASSLIIIRAKMSKINPRYLEYLLRSNIVKFQIDAVLSGVALKRVSLQKFSNLILLIPPLDEQIELIKLIENFIEIENEISNKSKAQIERLKEYRQSIISEAVTGKIDVRDWQAPNN